MTHELLPIAICYDFDGTLIRGNMQENSFLPDLDMDKQEFWNECSAFTLANDMDPVLSYMYLMIRRASERNRPFNRSSLQAHSQEYQFFPGVLEWFDIINDYGRDLGLDVKHYIISSGIDEMIKACPIGDKFSHIFASGFIYDANDVAHYPARAINYTNKIQYLFRINKGLFNSWDTSINGYMDDKDRHVPFYRMIYIGDGDTDVPAMKVINNEGGYSIAVYPPVEDGSLGIDEGEKRQAVELLHAKSRVKYIAEANYTSSGRLHLIMQSILRRIADEEAFDLQRKA